MDQAQKAILDFKSDSVSDDDFLECVREYSIKFGPAVYSAALKVLTGIDISDEEAPGQWQAALEHKSHLEKTLGRNIHFTTVLSDYLQTFTDHLINPRLIESTCYVNLVHDTIYDQLTSLFNRLYFDEIYSQQISLSSRYHTDLAVLFIDVDNFKEINDTYGHLAGDEALRKIAEIIDREKRDSDIAARYGGEEFILLMPHTNSINSFILAERIRKEIEENEFSFNDKTFQITISGGLAAYPHNSEDPAKLLEMADNAVYLSKGAGKNLISHYKKEKRRYLRVKIDQPILIQHLDFNDPNTFSGNTKDICIGGILFENDQSFPLNSLIKVEVPIGDHSSIFLIGKVVRIENFGENRFEIGMTTSFKELAKAADHEISLIIRNNSKDI